MNIHVVNLVDDEFTTMEYEAPRCHESHYNSSFFLDGTIDVTCSVFFQFIQG